MAGKIFINYRRDDVPGDARGIRDGLAGRFGKSSVFMDVDNLLAGQRFDRELDKALAQCDVLIAVIGPRWMELLRARATTKERDYVREEIAAALKRDITVIPVRAGREGTMPPMPRGDELPEDIRDLVLHQKQDVAHERFGRDIADLIAAIVGIRRGDPAPRPWGKIAAGVGALAVAAALAWAALMIMRPDTGLGPREDSPSKTTANAGEDRKQQDAAEAKWTQDEAERQRLAKQAADADEKRQSAEKEAARLRAEAEARIKADEAAAEAKRQEENRLAMLAAEKEKERAEVEAMNKAAEEAAKAAAVPKIGETFRDCPECPEMVVVPAGSFEMGSSPPEIAALTKEYGDHFEDEGPTRTVTIAKPFAVGKFEVTRGQFEAFVKATSFKVADECYIWTGSEWKKQAGSFRKPGFDQGDGHPAVCVSWDDAKAYVEWLSKSSGKSYRLLTEAEWEYATRAGTTGRWSFTGDETALCEYANHADRSASISWKNTKCSDGVGESTAEVGRYKANAFGLHDMHGNVWEWVEDCYKDSYTGAPTDGTAITPGDCSRRVFRGGSWISYPRNLRSALRDRYSTVFRFSSLGFRVGRTLTP